MRQFKVFMVVATILAASGAVFSLPAPVSAWTPVLDSAAFIDFDHDGAIDRVKVVFNGDVTACKFEVGDWPIGGGTLGLPAPTGRLNGSGLDADCDGSTNYFYLLVAGDPNETGYSFPYVPADIYYKNQGFLDDVMVNGVAAPNQSLINIDDNASPVIVSTSPVSGSTGVSRTLSNVSMTFSEPMGTATVLTSFSVGGWGGAVWSVDHKTVTYSRTSDLSYDTLVTVSVSGEDLNGYLLTSGSSPAVAIPWNFRVMSDPAAVVSATQSTVSASPTSVIADGAHISTVTVTVKNSAGSPLSGKTVTLASNRGSLDTIVTMVGTTDSDGKAYFQVSSTAAGNAIFEATAAGVVIEQTATVTFTAPASGPVSASRSNVYASPTLVVANNSDYSTVTVTVRDSIDVPLAGKTVILSSNRGATDTITVVSGTTNSAGQAIFRVKSGTTGTATLTAVADGVTITNTATVTFTSVPTLVYGDLFKESGTTTVYYYADNGKRYVFPTQAIYFSWYSDFSTVKTVSHSTVISIPWGGNVLVKPGTYLVQFVSMDTPFRVLDPKVYVLTATGQLRWVTSESVAASLYGADWARKIVAVPEVYKTNYGGLVLGADVVAASDYNKAAVEATIRTISDMVR